jgi:predicted transcriptional regulator
MSQVEALEQTIRTLPKEQVRELQEWLQDYVEDLEEMRPEFVARLDRAQQQLDGAWAAWLTLFAAQGIGCDAGTRLVP